MDDDSGNRPVGFLGKLRGMKGLTWVLIIAVVAITIGATTLLLLFQ